MDIIASFGKSKIELRDISAEDVDPRDLAADIETDLKYALRRILPLDKDGEADFDSFEVTLGSIKRSRKVVEIAA